MKREDFVNVAEETLDSLPEEFRSRIQNVAILVEDFPPNQSSPRPGQQRRLLLGIFHGVPATKKSVFNLPAGPDHIVLYQKNIEAVCSNEAEVRHQIRQTLIHELGQHADFLIMPTTNWEQQFGGARALPRVGIIKGFPGRLTAYRQVGSVLV